MNKFYYFIQCMAIAICSTCAVIVLNGLFFSCHAATTPDTAHTMKDSTVTVDYMNIQRAGSINDKDSVMLVTCENLLDACADSGILDAKGIECYKQLKDHKSVRRYIALIEECSHEENFFDTVGAGDEWANFEWFVLEPFGMAE